MSSQSDLTMIEEMLKGLLLPDNTLRREAESKFQTLMQNREPFCTYLSQILLQSTDFSIQTYAAIIIRKIFLIKNSEISSKIWLPFKPESKTSIKSNLLSSLSKVTNKSLRKKIIDAIQNVYICISENDEKWDELLQLTVNGFNLELNESNLENIEVSLNILSAIFDIGYDQLKEGINIYVKSFSIYFKSNSLELKALSVKCIVEILCASLSKKEAKAFKDLVFYMLETTLQCLNANDNANLKICLDALCDLSSTTPKIMRKSFSDIFILMGKIINNKMIDDSLREIAFELLMNIIEQVPKVISKDEEKLNLLIQAIFKYAMEIDSTIDDDWLKPSAETYFSDEFIAEDKLDEATSLLKRLLDALEADKLLTLISNNIMELLKHSTEDWKFKYIAYITIAEVVEYVPELKNIEQLIGIILNDLNNTNPKVQYACLYCIAEIADEHNPDFQNYYHSKIIPQLLNVMQNTQILRIQLEVCDALECFVEHLTDQDAGLYLQSSLDVLFGLFIKDSTLCPSSLKQGILNVVSQFIEASSEEFKKYAEKCFKILLDHLNINIKEGKDKNLLGMLLESIATIGPLCPELFNTYLINIVDILTQVQLSFNSFNESIANYIFSTWEKVVPPLLEKNKEKVPQIIESLIILLKKPPEMSIANNPQNTIDVMKFFQDDEKETEDKEGKKGTISTSETEEFTVFISILNLFLKSAPEIGSVYIQQIYPIANALLKYPNEDIQGEISETYYRLIGGIKTGDKNILHQTAKQYIADIVTQLEKEKDFTIIVDLLDSVREIIDQVKMFLVTAEINELCLKLLGVFDKVEKARISLLEQKKQAEKEIEEDKKTGDNKYYSDDEDDDEDEEIIEDIKDQIQELEEVQTSFSDFFAKVFETHKQLTLEIVDKLIKEYIPKYFRNEASNFEKKLGLLLIDDMAEFLGQELLNNIWNDIAKIMIQFSTNSDYDLRNAAAYGIGVFAKFTSQNFGVYANDLLIGVTNAMKFPADIKKSEKEDMQFAKDNAVSALGKIIQYHGKEIDAAHWIDVWINEMPIKEDKEEGKLMNNFLMQILENSANLVLGADNKNLEKIVVTLAKGYNTDFSDSGCDQKMVEFVKLVKENTELNNKLLQIVQSKSDSKTKNKIIELFKLK